MTQHVVAQTRLERARFCIPNAGGYHLPVTAPFIIFGGMLRFELRSLVSQTSQLTTIYMSHIKIPEELSCENLREPKICSTMFTVSL